MNTDGLSFYDMQNMLTTMAAIQATFPSFDVHIQTPAPIEHEDFDADAVVTASIDMLQGRRYEIVFCLQSWRDPIPDCINGDDRAKDFEKAGATPDDIICLLRFQGFSTTARWPESSAGYMRIDLALSQAVVTLRSDLKALINKLLSVDSEVCHQIHMEMNSLETAKATNTKK